MDSPSKINETHSISFLEKVNLDIKAISIMRKIIQHPLKILKIEQFCEGLVGAKEIRRYNCYKVTTNKEIYVLKKTTIQESEIYENFLSKHSFSVPTYYGKYIDCTNCWILLEFIEGKDLRNFSNEMAYLCAESITEIMNESWMNKEDYKNIKQDRFDKYMNRILRRSECLKNEIELKKDYDKFILRQKDCPRTFCNGDFLQFNAIYNKRRVVLIDWAFGGMMPYSLDIARLIAHGTENRITFPFYMNDEQRRIFVDTVYEKLIIKPDYNRYLLDIKLSLLNECIEFIEEDLNHPNEIRDVSFEYYYNTALNLSNEINKIIEIDE